MQFQNYTSGSSPRYVIIIIANKWTAQLQVQADECDLSVLDARIKSTIEDLTNVRPIIDRIGSVSSVGRTFIEFGKDISGLNSMHGRYLT